MYEIANIILVKLLAEYSSNKVVERRRSKKNMLLNILRDRIFI